ncbi:TrbG/VirB9 family P-type conjugative transfer protein [Veillonella sp. VA142]|uniref:TrbG/VirB9 family P-type conjugative transfer protein n=1 Tax=Veillonella sp. VA142 TaxID=741834 RepID=UPI000F8D0387|nr:TrbG/VirB9 family P-type conjugative transfer protein [Veillonella sp. VA142]
MKKSLQIALAAFALTTALGSTTFAEGTQYYPTYRDGVTNVYTYGEYKQFEINTRVGYITDVQLRPNEVLQKIATGNSTQWSVDHDVVGGIQHVYIKPLASDLRTNFIINTDKRSYRLLVNSTNETEYSVAFIFPNEDKADYLEKQEQLRLQKEAQEQKEKALANRALYINYKVKKNHHVPQDFLPKSVFDDGTKTYIELPENVQDNFPTVYSYDKFQKNKIQLVNYRLKGNVLEVDKIMPAIKLVFNQNSYLMITKDEKQQTIPSPDKIELNKQMQPEPLLKLLHSNTQAETVTFKDTYVGKAEREHKKHVEEQKEFIRDTQQPQVAPQQESTKLISNEEIDKMIQKLEADIGSMNTPSQMELPSAPATSPMVLPAIDKN